MLSLGQEKMDGEWVVEQIQEKTDFDILNLPDNEELSIASLEDRLFRVDIVKNEVSTKQ